MNKDKLRQWEIQKAFGNGNTLRGKRLIEDIARRLMYARGKHVWAYKSQSYGVNAVLGEAHELEKAVVCEEGPQRVYDEALDTIVTSIRMTNGEWKQNADAI